MDDATLYRIGGWAAIVGGVLAIVVNVLQPRQPEEMISATAAGTSNWELLQMGVVVTVLLALAVFYAVSKSIADAPGRGWARFGLGAAIMGATIGVVFFSILSALPRAAEAFGVDALGAAEAVTGGMFYAWQITFFGLPAVLFGLAFIASHEYPTWLGWVGLVGGVVGLVSGFSDALAGATDATTFILFPVSSGLLTLVIIYLGVLLLRKEPA